MMHKLTEELEHLYENIRQSDEDRKKKIKLRRYLYDLLEPFYCKSISFRISDTKMITYTFS